ncbi:Polygalacturonase 1 beta-like protein 1 [Sesamum angolense]|uniref:Polygalacturonase 1 beta-like protein 1 n=1 Tax=Sesamum angolense TaxID=2727404 RepID=A0AAE1X717_9LAMI|nr:Polygalacturonase 1 beta-like protein 1 [Sesamum angolense]
MPEAISKKLSPLTKHDSEYYAETISNDNFKADSKFCSLAKLACSTVLDDIKAINSQRRRHNPSFGLERIPSLSRVSSASNRVKNYFDPKTHCKCIPESSKEAIGTTLSYCNADAIKGELKVCPKSLEEMIHFSKSALGKDRLLALTSKSTKGSGDELKIGKIKQFDVEKIIACHEMYLPFATYFCHSLPSSRIYSVDFVETKSGAPVNTVLAICHMDTSSWPADHVAFQILKSVPGQGEACHWLNEIDLAWIAGGPNM